MCLSTTLTATGTKDISPDVTGAHHDEQKKDERYTLTESERKAVAALKEACDKENVSYNSIFELAKFVLVSHSSAKDSNPKADKIRLQTALKRIQRRRAWEKKHGMDNRDPISAMKAIYDVAPDYLMANYDVDLEDHIVCAFHAAYGPDKYIYESKENHSLFLHVVATWLDLCAADMVEARQGIAIIVYADVSLSQAFRYIKVIAKVQDTLKDMHPNRIRCVHSLVPSYLTHLVAGIKMMLPKKISERVRVYSKKHEFEKNLVKPTTPIDKLEWTKQRLAAYKETVERVQLFEENEQ